MKFQKTIPEFQIEPSFPQQIDIKNILPFISPIPNLNINDKLQSNNFKQVFIDSKSKINQKKRQIKDFVSKSLQSIQASENYYQKNKCSIKQIKSPETSYEKANQIRKLEIIHHKFSSIVQRYKKALINYQNKIERFISDLTIVCEWFISNPRPFYIDIEDAFPDISYQFYCQNKELVKHLNMLNYAVIVNSQYLSLLPDRIFCETEELNRDFLNNVLQTAMNQKKDDTSYFEPLKCEESLFLFFQSKHSPILSKIKELDKIRTFSKPLYRKSGNDSENGSELHNFVISWIKEASSIILNFEEKNQNEPNSIDDRKSKMDAIEILVVRFVFNVTFPYLDWQPLPDPSFSRQIEELSRKTARNHQISLNFLHPELADVECTKIFERDSASRAPIEWITSAQFQVCPLRTAYCMCKVHESLTIMATIAATDNEMIMHQNMNNSESNNDQNMNNAKSNDKQNMNKESSNDKQSMNNGKLNDDQNSSIKAFFSKVPGFDDIFNFWVCLICSAKLADTRGLNQFIKEWWDLPGFSNRAKASCTYFEAAITHIESGEAFEKCKT